MKLFKNILDFSIDASVWVAISVAAFVGVTCLNIEISLDVNLMSFVFFGTIFGYNFIKYFEKKKIVALEFDAKKLAEQFATLSIKQKTTLLLSVLSVLICSVLFIEFAIETKLALIFSLILTLFYAVSFGYTTLRNIKGIKIYIVALVWVLVTVLLPIMESKLMFTSDILILMFRRFIFIVVLILPFDIRDVSVDDKALGTLPQRFGIKVAKLYGLVLLMLFFFLEFFKDELLAVNIIVMPFIFLTTLLFLFLAKENQSKYYSSFFVEGIPVFWFVLLMVL